MSDLIERLRAEEPMGVLSGCCDTVKLVNPDGPKAATLIEAQQAEIARLLELVEGAYNEGYMHALYDAPCLWAGSKSCAALEQKP